MFFKVTCGCCHQDMSLTEYKKVHCFTHYNLSWLNGEKLPVSQLAFTFKILYVKYLNNIPNKY